MGKYKEVKCWEQYDEDGNLNGNHCPSCGFLGRTRLDLVKKDKNK